MQRHGIKIMSFNLRVNSALDGPNAWPLRAERAAALIRQYAPDVIGFQEMQQVHWKSLAELLPAYGRAAGPKCDNQEPWAYPGLFWNLDRLHLLKQGGFYLSQTPERFSGDWGTGYIRAAVWAQLRLNAFSELPLLFLNTHLDNQSEEARVGQSGVLIGMAEKIGRAGQAVFITGDFNCKPGSAAHGQFLAAGYRDLFLDAGRADDPQSGTFHNYTGQPLEKWGRIDWILAQPGVMDVKTVGFDIPKDGDAPLFPSDHFPVIATVALGATPPPPAAVASAATPPPSAAPRGS